MKYLIHYFSNDLCFKGFYDTIEQALSELKQWLSQYSLTLESSSQNITLLKYSKEFYNKTLEHNEKLKWQYKNKKVKESLQVLRNT